MQPESMPLPSPTWATINVRCLPKNRVPHLPNLLLDLRVLVHKKGRMRKQPLISFFLTFTPVAVLYSVAAVSEADDREIDSAQGSDYP